jgi:hypothetical protein
LKQSFDGFAHIAMAPNLTILVSLMLAYVVVTEAAIAQRKSAANAVQTSFGSETPIKRPAKIPADVLKQLWDENGKQIARCEELSSHHLPPAKYFVASAIDINGDRSPDLVIQAAEFCLQGAHNTPFWVFTKMPADVGGYELVFKTQTDWLEIRKTSTTGYRDIAAIGHTAVTMFTTILKFDGQKYQPRTCTVENVRTKRTTRIACRPRE